MDLGNDQHIDLNRTPLFPRKYHNQCIIEYETKGMQNN